MFGIDFFRSEKKDPNHKPRRLVGRKPPLKLKEIWAIRVHLHVSRHCRDLALFNLAIDSKLRACDLVTLRVQDLCQSGQVAARAIVMQQKTKRPVQFEITEQTRAAVSAWIERRGLTATWESRSMTRSNLLSKPRSRTNSPRCGLHRADGERRTMMVLLSDPPYGGPLETGPSAPSAGERLE